MKKSTSIFVATIFFFAVSLSLIGCKKYENLHLAKTAWDPNLAVPLGHAKFDVYDVLAHFDSTDLIIVDPSTGALALVYSSEFASFDAGTIVSLGDINQNFTLNTADLNVPTIPVFLGTANSFRTEQIQLNPLNGAELYTVHFKSGVINMHFETDLRHDMNVTLTFPDLQISGVPMTTNFNLTYSGSVPQTADIQIDLTDAIGDFTQGGTTFNEMNVQIQAAVIGTGQIVTGNETFSMDVASSNLNFFDASGYFGPQSVGQDADSVLLKIFKNATTGTFELQNPEIDFTIDNSFGFPVDIHLGNLKSINVSSGVETPLLNYPTDISVNYPTVLGQSETTHFVLNTSNTDNLSSIISPTPKYFYYEVDATANPNGQPPTPNFIKDDSKFTLRADVNMPLDGLAYGFFVSDTVDFKFNQNTDHVESVMFRLIVDNGFPCKLGTQITALGVNDNVLFTLFNQPEDVVQSASVDNNGVVTSPTNKITDIELNNAQINKLNDIKKIVIYGEVETKDALTGQYVKIFDYYKIDLKVALQVQGSTSF